MIVATRITNGVTVEVASIRPNKRGGGHVPSQIPTQSRVLDMRIKNRPFEWGGRTVIIGIINPEGREGDAGRGQPGICRRETLEPASGGRNAIDVLVLRQGVGPAGEAR
jgi:hypothetical protein